MSPSASRLKSPSCPDPNLFHGWRFRQRRSPAVHKETACKVCGLLSTWNPLPRCAGRANYTLRLTLSCVVLIVKRLWTLHSPSRRGADVFYVSQLNVLMIKLVMLLVVTGQRRPMAYR